MNWKQYFTLAIVAANMITGGCFYNPNRAKPSNTDTEIITTTSQLPTTTTAATTAMTSTTAGASTTNATDGAGSGALPSTSSLVTGSESGTTGESCTFMSCEDVGADAQCDNFAQDCPEGQKCAAFIDGGNTWNALKCVEVDPQPSAPGEACTSMGANTGIDSCDKGAMCWDIQNGVGTCVALCKGTLETPTCPDLIKCTIDNDNTLNLCLPGCSPLLQDCGDGEACYPVGGDFTCEPDASGDAGQANELCEYINVCDKGLWCAEPAAVGAGCMMGSPGCCTPFCDINGPLKCPNMDQMCVPWYDVNPPPGLENVGYCGVPV